MLILLSPAKLQQFDRPLFDSLRNQTFAETSGAIARTFADKSVAEIASLMKISEEKAEEVRSQFQSFENSVPVAAGLSVYNGPAFTALNPFDFSAEEKKRCARQLLILSGLYGIVHADSAIVPYRLEIGLSGTVGDQKNLYALWKPLVTSYIDTYCREQNANAIVNCASGEYAKAVDFKSLSVPVITVDFREMKGEKAVSVSSFAKQARGSMARWIIVNNPRTFDDLRRFSENGYRFSPDHSTDSLFCFVR